MTDNAPALTRTDPEDLHRAALANLTDAVDRLLRGWGSGDPERQGELWKALRSALRLSQDALRVFPDPKPGQCGVTWHDPLDGVWDRCGLPHGHQGSHKASYLMGHDNLRVLTIHAEAGPGTIQQTVGRAVGLAKAHECSVSFDFNDVSITVGCTNTAKEILDWWDMLSGDKRRGSIHPYGIEWGES